MAEMRWSPPIYYSQVFNTFMLMKMRLAAVLLCMLILGCGKSESVDPLKPSPTSVPPAGSKTEPQVRDFDVAAEQELKQLGHTDPEEQAAITQKYANVRWRFTAEVMRLDAAEPSQFHQGTITVQPEGMSRTYVRLRSQEVKAKLYPGQKHQFEGTFERYILQSGLDALVFNDVTLAEM